MGRPGSGVLPRPLACLAVLTLWGCTSVDTEAERQIAEQRLPRPAMIVVHDFAVSPDEVQAGQPWSSARLVQDTARTEAEKAVGHAFADEFAAALVEEIRKLGLPAERANAPNLPSGDIVTIEGRFISLAGDPSAPGIVGFAGGWPDVLADVQLYGTNTERRAPVRGPRGQPQRGRPRAAGRAPARPDDHRRPGRDGSGAVAATAGAAGDRGQAGGRHRGRAAEALLRRPGVDSSRPELTEARHGIRGGGGMNEESAAAATRLLDCPTCGLAQSLGPLPSGRARIASAATRSSRTAPPATATRGRSASR